MLSVVASFLLLFLHLLLCCLLLVVLMHDQHGAADSNGDCDLLLHSVRPCILRVLLRLVLLMLQIKRFKSKFINQYQTNHIITILMHSYYTQQPALQP